MRKGFKELTIKDAFMFVAVMSDAERCRRFLSMALEMEIAEVHVIAEKSMAYHPEYKGVRLDVWAVEKGRRRRFVADIKKRVEAIKHDRDWEGRFMLLEELMEIERQEGMEKGQKRVNRLNELLIAAGRMHDIEVAVKDPAYQEQLFREFDL